MKILQLVRIIARVLLLLAGTGAAAIGALQFAPQGCSEPMRELPASALTNVAAPAAPMAEKGWAVRVVDGNTLIPTLLKREAVSNLLCRFDARKLSAAGKRVCRETTKEPALTLY